MGFEGVESRLEARIDLQKLQKTLQSFLCQAGVICCTWLWHRLSNFQSPNFKKAHVGLKSHSRESLGGPVMQCAPQAYQVVDRVPLAAGKAYVGRAKYDLPEPGLHGKSPEAAVSKELHFATEPDCLNGGGKCIEGADVNQLHIRMRNEKA